MAGTKAGARKRQANLLAKNPNHYKDIRDRMLAKNPNHYSDMSKKAVKPRGGAHSVGTFKPGSIEASKAGRKGGKISKRKKYPSGE